MAFPALLRVLFAAVAGAVLTSAHMILTYPGSRGNNLITNSTWPYGMQWIYPCGGMSTTTNRTYWPTTGGAVGLQPGWFQGHLSALMYINLGFGTDGPDGGPPNMSNPMVPAFEIIGPSNEPYPGSICLPQVPLPAGAKVSPGDNATIQVVEIAKHGAALFTCVDITFVEPGDSRLAEVNSSNCANSSDIGFGEVYTLTLSEPNTNGTVGTATSDALSRSGPPQPLFGLAGLGWLPLLLGAVWLQV